MPDRPAYEEIKELASQVTPEMVAEFERILFDSGMGSEDILIWKEEVARFLYQFRQFRRNHAQFLF